MKWRLKMTGHSKQVDVSMQKGLNYKDRFWTCGCKSRASVLVTTPLTFVTDSANTFVYTADCSASWVLIFSKGGTWGERKILLVLRSFFVVIYVVIRNLQRGRSPAAEIYELGKLQNLLQRLVFKWHALPWPTAIRCNSMSATWTDSHLTFRHRASYI
jgi:hypothetical protein